MLLSGGNGVGKSTLVGRWVRQLETRLYTPVNLTQATLSSSGLLATLTRSLGKPANLTPDGKAKLLASLHRVASATMRGSVREDR